MMAVGLRLLITCFWGLRSARMCTAAAHERNERAHRPSASPCVTRGDPKDHVSEPWRPRL